MSSDRTPSITAIVPAYEREDTVGATVAALRSLAPIGEVVVVDDGSADSTSAVAEAAGATVIRLADNRGKAAAVAAGVSATDSDVVLLIDADTGASATEAAELLVPVVRDAADMSIAVLPSAAGQGGLGMVRDVAAEIVQSATGLKVDAPLSGQRALRREWWEHLGPVDRFGLEIALTVDLHRAGARILEVPTRFDHRHTGRGVDGFTHRARQGVDLLQAASTRIGWRRALTVCVRSLGRRVTRR